MIHHPDPTILTDSSASTASGPLELLRARFAAVPDARSAGCVLHSIDEVLIIALCSMLSDNDAFTDMEQFARSQMPWLRTFLPMPHGPPSHDVFRNVFMAIKPEALLLIMADWCGDLSSHQIMIDGKTLRGTATATRKGMVHILRAWVHAAGLSAGHAVCSEKSNELTALPQLLALLELKGTLVSIDAMGTHPDIAAQIHEAGGDYLLASRAIKKEPSKPSKLTSQHRTPPPDTPLKPPSADYTPAMSLPPAPSPLATASNSPMVATNSAFAPPWGISISSTKAGNGPVSKALSGSSAPPTGEVR